MKQFLTAFSALVLLTSAGAQVLYQQDFEHGFQDMMLIDNDGLTPSSQLWNYTGAWNVTGDLLGNAAVSLSSYEPAGQSDDWMITRVISGITAKAILEWDARAFEPSSPDGYKVLISIGGTNIGDFTGQVFQVDGEMANGAYTHHYVLLDDYAGKNIHIAFVNNTNNRYLLGVDNIVVRNVRDIDAALLQVNVDTYVRTGVANNINYTLKNNGFQTIDTVVVNWSDGINDFSETLTGLDLDFGEEYAGTFTDAFTATNADEYPLNFTITSVGSHPDELSTNNSVTVPVASVTTVVPRRIVGEEATGTWCGWCPRGAVFMERAHEAYPDLFIPIAIHSNDPMTNNAYNDAFAIFYNYPGSPSVSLDRKIIIDPRNIETNLLELQQVVAPVAVTVQTTLDSLTRQLNIEGKITAYTDRTNAKHNLVLVVAESDVRGTGNGYRQNNYYSGGGEGPMGGFENLPGSVPASQMHYDFVGRELLYGFNGLPGVLPATFHENDEFSFTATYIVPATYDMDQLYVVAMVVDSASGVVLNAAKSAALTSAVQEDIKELGSLKIYPNPAQGMAYLDMKLTEAAVVTVALVNPLGQTVRTHDAGLLPVGHSVVSVRVNGLAGGVYLVKVNIGGKVVLRRVVVE